MPAATGQDITRSNDVPRRPGHPVRHAQLGEHVPEVVFTVRGEKPPGHRTVRQSLRRRAGQDINHTVLSFALHVLFSPWLLVAVAILAWIKFRPRRSHR
jgi:hypothetical protein